MPGSFTVRYESEQRLREGLEGESGGSWRLRGVTRLPDGSATAEFATGADTGGEIVRIERETRSVVYPDRGATEREVARLGAEGWAVDRITPLSGGGSGVECVVPHPAVRPEAARGDLSRSPRGEAGEC